MILHIDADAFFVSVEQVLRPDLKGLPVVVGGSDRGVVSSASYEARRYGIRSAMPIVQAARLCPQAVFLRPNFDAYKKFSVQMFAVMRRHSPRVETTSIDEGYIDLTGTLRLNKGSPVDVAGSIMGRIRDSLGINVSGGLAVNRIWSKMATDHAKPNGLLYLEPGKEVALLGNNSVGTIPGIGKRSEETLVRNKIKTVSDLLEAPISILNACLGRWGEKLFRSFSLSGNISENANYFRKSYSMERTLDADTTDCAFLHTKARELTEKLAAGLRADKRGATTIALKIRYSNFEDKINTMNLKYPTNENSRLVRAVDRLFGRMIMTSRPVRQIGVKLAGIDEPVFQEELFDAHTFDCRKKDVVIDVIRSKFGFDCVKVAGT